MPDVDPAYIKIRPGTSTKELQDFCRWKGFCGRAGKLKQQILEAAGSFRGRSQYLFGSRNKLPALVVNSSKLLRNMNSILPSQFESSKKPFQRGSGYCLL